MRKLALYTFCITLITLTWCSPASACLIAPLTYDDLIGQSALESILIQADGVQDLILRVKVKRQKSRKKAPKQLAWIVTIPTKPTAYRITIPSNPTALGMKRYAFQDLYLWKRKLAREDPNNPVKGGLGMGRRGGLAFGRKVWVGSTYEIQPIQGSSKKDAVLLNKWLTKNGFKAVDPKQLHYFLENKFTFLCIKIDLKKNRSHQPAPLQVTFPSKKLYYPLKLSSHQGTFDLHLYTITKKPLSYARSLQTLRKIGFTRPPPRKRSKLILQPPFQEEQDEASALLNPYGYRRNMRWHARQLPSSVRLLLHARKTPKTRWYVNYIHIEKFNHNGAMGRWKKDTFFTLGATKADHNLQKLRARLRSKSDYSNLRWSLFFRRHKKPLTKKMNAWLATINPASQTPTRPRVAAVKATTKIPRIQPKPKAPPKRRASGQMLLLPGVVAALLLLAFGFLAWRRKS